SCRGGPSVSQIVAVFDRRDALLRAMAAAKTYEIRIVTAFSPAFDPEIVAAAAAASAVSLWTLVGGIAGAIGGLALPIWTVRQWPTLIVGGKPIVALPPFLIIAFASTILVAVCAAFIGFVVGGHRMRRIVRAAYEPSFSEDRFGLLVACRSTLAASIGELMTRSGAGAWRVV